MGAKYCLPVICSNLEMMPWDNSKIKIYCNNKIAPVKCNVRSKEKLDMKVTSQVTLCSRNGIQTN